MKKKKKYKGLSHYPPTSPFSASLSLPSHSLALGETEKGNPIRNRQKSERDTQHRREVPRFSEMPLSSPPLLLSTPLLSVDHSPSLSTAFPSSPPPPSRPLALPRKFSILPSAPRHLPALTPDTAPPLRFHPFSSAGRPAVAAALQRRQRCRVYRLHILSPAFLTPTSAPRYRASKKWIPPHHPHPYPIPTHTRLLTFCCVWVRASERQYRMQLNMPNDD